MKKDNKTSLAFRNDVLAILDSIAAQKGKSRSEIVEHLIVYHGLCGGEFPLTERILGLPPEDKNRVLSQILGNYKAGKFLKPQSFMLWVKETLGSDDSLTQGAGADSILRRLLE